MPLNYEKTYNEFGYRIEELSFGSSKFIYYNCDICCNLFKKTMQKYQLSLKFFNTQNVLCQKCRIKFNSIKNKKFNCNENYFAEKSLQACYWAGFIAADGCIHKRKEGQNIFSIQLSQKDKYHLINFKNDIEYNGNIIKILVTKKTRIIGKYQFINNNNSYVLSISSQKICDDLASIFNIHPRKSLTHEPPIGLTEEQELAFLIGYIDGDGCISVIKNYKDKNGFPNNRLYPIYFQILGTELFLNWAKSKIIKFSTFKFNGKVCKTKSKAFQIQIRGKFAYDVLTYLSKISVPKLERKWDKIKNFTIPIYER
jgi:hypothetical protein